jgi:hypothetical protein
MQCSNVEMYVILSLVATPFCSSGLFGNDTWQAGLLEIKFKLKI